MHLTSANHTLKALAELCQQSKRRGCGIQSVVTYNYDNLLEVAAVGGPCQFVPVWKPTEPLKLAERPIFHVHGYLPATRGGSAPTELVFTEAEYHAAANDPYSWSNLCQIQCLSNSVGLMVGLSLKDRNMRRLLSALKVTSLRKPTYALLSKPTATKPTPAALDEIHRKALDYRRRFERSGSKGGTKEDSRRAAEMLEIFKELDRHELENQTKMLINLGISPIWYDSHSQIPVILRKLIS